MLKNALRPDGLSRFDVYASGQGAPAFALEGNRGYLVSLLAARSFA